MAERQKLLDILMAWREQAHADDPYRSVWPITRLIDNDGLELLSKTHPTGITSPSDLIVLLDETEEWGTEYGTKLFAIIKQFDQGNQRQCRQVKPQVPSCVLSETRAVKRAKVGAVTPNSMYMFAPIQTPESFVAI